MEMDAASIGQAIAALVFVVALICLAAIGLRQHGGKVKKAEEARLAIVEILPLDPRNRLVLVRRDGVQHLLAIGQDHGVTVVERDIDVPEDASDDSDGPSLSFGKPANKKKAKDELQTITEAMGRAVDA